MCFPLDKTGKWYLVKHSCLMEAAKDYGWLKKNIWKTKGLYWTWSGTEEVRKALEEFSYEECHGYRRLPGMCSPEQREAQRCQVTTTVFQPNGR